MQVIKARPITSNIDRKELDIFYQKNLSSVVADENAVYGKRSKPRHEDPSMQDLLQWHENQSEIWNFKTNNTQILQKKEANPLKFSISKSKNPYVSEQQEAFNKFTFAPDGQTVLIELPDGMKGKFEHGKTQYIPLSTYQIDYNNNGDGEGFPKQFDNCYGNWNMNEWELNNNNNNDNFQNQNEQNKNGLDDPDHLNKNASGFTDDDLNKSHDNNDGHLEKDKSNKKRKSKSKKRKGKHGTLPPFVNYGNKNVTPSAGGFLYGNYLHSHSINPHRCPNQPEYKESYNNAINNAKQKKQKGLKKPRAPTKVKQEEEARLEKKLEIWRKSGKMEWDKNDLSCIEDQLQNDQDKNIQEFAKVGTVAAKTSQSALDKNQVNLCKQQFNKFQQRTQNINQPDQEKKRNSMSKLSSYQPENYFPTSYQNSNYPQQDQNQQYSTKKFSKKVILPQELRATQKLKLSSQQSQSSVKQPKQPRQSTNNQSQYSQIDETQQALDFEQERFDKELEAKWNHKFLAEAKEKQLLNQRFTNKVTQIIPAFDHSLNQLQTYQKCQKEEGEVTLGEFSEAELNPKNYKNRNAKKLERIPFAGSTLKRQNQGIQLG